jgi:hypothetical protein
MYYCKFHVFIEEPGYPTGIALGYWLDDGRLEYRQVLGIFLFITASRPALRPNQLPIRGLFLWG